jgi:hypothetical protein
MDFADALCPEPTLDRGLEECVRRPERLVNLPVIVHITASPWSRTGLLSDRHLRPRARVRQALNLDTQPTTTAAADIAGADGP